MHQNPQWVNKWFNTSLSDLKSSNVPVIDSNQIGSTSFKSYDFLSNQTTSLSLAVLKLNGGLGTSMGCKGPKSLIKISPDGKTFMDRIIQSFKNQSVATDLIFLNSFNTSNQTTLFLNDNYPDLVWRELLQFPFKKINSNNLEPVSSNQDSAYNPPGHGSVFYDLYHSGILDDLLKKGTDYIFISNADNLAAYPDLKILAYLEETNCPFLMELTPKTEADVKGGTLINYQNKLKLWEIAQVDSKDLALFSEQPYFNTNNIWVSVPYLHEVISSNALKMDLIKNKKSTEFGDVIQMEYAMGSAIQSFNNASGLVVPRTRFFPVKRTSDLLLLISDFCSWSDNGELQWDVSKKLPVTLQPPFDNVDDFFRLLSVVPSIKDALTIKLKGEIHFNEFVTLSGDTDFNNQTGVLQPISSYIQ